MFSTIYNYEISYWIKNPMIYLFSGAMFFIPFLTMWGMSAEANTGDNIVMMNSYYKINNMATMFSLILIFLLPAIIGHSIYRDYSSRMYTLMYSLPFTKKDYLLAKFASAFSIVLFILLALVFAFLLGSFMPGVETEAILPFDSWNYFQLLIVFLIPNMLFFGAVVLAITLYTRNVYISFIGVIFMVIIQSFGKGVLGANGWDMLAVLTDPTGEAAVKYTVRFWTLEERNHNVLPLNEAIILNRVFWMVVTFIILCWSYCKFEFNQFVSSRKIKSNDAVLEAFIPKEIPNISIPNVNKNYSLRNRFKIAWHLSTVDFRSIVWSWPFISILFAGSMLVLFQQYQMGPQEGIVSIPTTSNMLRFPMFFFSAIVNLLTFLYAGVLMYRGEQARMIGFLDSTPQPNWVFLVSKLIGLFKMQAVLLTIVLIGGLVAQIIGGYYRFEFWHYFFELYVLQAVHFMAWACLAICMHSIAKNMYLGYFLLLLVPVYNLLLPFLADYIEADFLKNSLFQFNSVQGIFLGFDYSEFTGYGYQLMTYFTYKFYWLICSIGLALIALLFWKRGNVFSFKERLEIIKERSVSRLGLATFLGFLFFMGTGFTIYYQENYVSKVHFSNKEVERISYENEVKFGHLEHLVQPKLSDVKVKMDLYPESQNFHLLGTLVYINKVNHVIDTILIAQSLKEETVCHVLQAHEVVDKNTFLNYDLIVLEEGMEKGDSLEIRVKISNYQNSLLHKNSRVEANGTYINSRILPEVGIRDAFLSKKKDREKFGLPDREKKILNPEDTSLLGYEFLGNNMGLINYECHLSTSVDQTAFTMGEMQNSWVEKGRRKYHYKSDGLIQNTISWLSGVYERLESESEYQHLEMYRHPVQEYNDEHFFHGLSTSLDYCSEWFGPLAYDTMRIVEFPETAGTYATVDGNLIPYSEVYFKCDVHDHENDVFNMPFFVSAHEIAHSWWGHRVDPANVNGGRMITEGMADYLAMKAIEQEFDPERLFLFRKKYHEIYLEERANQANETPLIYSSLNNEYLNYRKASLSIYSLSEYIGEDVLNTALAKFEERYRHTEPPFPTSLDFVGYLKEASPDSLKYLVSDMFESIRLYDNKILDVKQEKQNQSYLLRINLLISKYDANKKGKRIYGDEKTTWKNISSLHLNDFIEVGFYDSEGTLQEKKMIKFSKIKNELEFTFDNKISRVEIDPNYLLIDAERADNGFDVK